MVETSLGLSLFLFAVCLTIGLITVLNWKRADRKARAVMARVSPGIESPWYYKVGFLIRLVTAVIAFAASAYFLIRIIGDITG